MKKDHTNSRRSFLRLGTKNSEPKHSEMVKMLTSDGQLVWVAKKNIKKGDAKTSNRDILDWRKPGPNK